MKKQKQIIYLFNNDKARKELIKEFEKMIDKIKHSGWISKDILYDNCEEQEDICVIDLEELKQQLKELKEKIK